MVDIQAIKNAARGRWFSIFQQVGIEIPENGYHGPCPIESAGEDRFRCDNKDGDGTWICTNCGAGDGISLVRQCLELSFPDTIKTISEVVGMGTAKPDETRSKQDYDPKTSLNNLWKASTKLTGGDPVSKYLHARGLVLEPESVRYCPECWESSTKSKMPAMVSMFVNPSGKAVSLHRTYLNGTGKADIKSPRKLMKGTEYLTGGAIRLFPPNNNTIGIAEGIETAIAAHQIAGVPCWAAVSSTLLKGFQPPADIRRVVIFGDNDPNFCGQQAAYSLANRLYNKDLLVEVELPPNGNDWNDWLLEQKT